MGSGLLAVGAAGAAVVLSLGLITVVTSSDAQAVQCLPSSVSVSGAVPASAALDPEQTADATAIVQAVVARRMPTRAAVIAVAAAEQESSLRVEAVNGDHLGLFQQDPGWGTAAQRTDPTGATNAFLAALAQVDNWEVLPLAQAAEAVQHSGQGEAYARWEAPATVIVNALLGRSTDTGAVNENIGDAPGLYAEGDSLLAGIAAKLPVTYNGGPVTSVTTPDRTTSAGIGDLTAHTATLPGTVLVALGAHDGLTVTDEPGFTAQVKAVLALAGPTRNVFWLTAPGADAQNAALRALAAADDRLHLVDTAAAAATHPGWLQGGAITPAGYAGIATTALNALAANTGDDPTSSTTTNGTCADGLGGYSAVPVPDCTFALDRPNPRACPDAIRWALAQQDGPPQWYRRCLSFVARAYGLAHSGVGAPYTARQFWLESTHQHPGDRNPPAGALVFWNGGSAGHVALSAGNGQVVSTDIRGHGTIALVPLTEITSRWNDPYLGWTEPDFPHAGGAS